MLRILVPFDGSACSLRALHHVVAMQKTLRPALEVVLINVQPPAPVVDMMLDGRPSDVRRLTEPLKAQGAKILESGQRILEQAGIASRSFAESGKEAQLIVDYAKTYHCEMIVMGTRDRGALTSTVLGSVANKVLQLAELPVVLVP